MQHKIIKNQVKDTALFDNQGVCYSCKFFEEKEKINWDDREKEFLEILENLERMMVLMMFWFLVVVEKIVFLHHIF